MLHDEGLDDLKVSSQGRVDYANRYIRWSAGVLGATTAILIWVWPDHAFLLQEVLYSTLVIGLIFFAVWSERRKPNYWKAWLAIVALHGLVAWVAKPLFPFHTFWIVAVVIVIECSALALVFYKIVGE